MARAAHVLSLLLLILTVFSCAEPEPPPPQQVGVQNHDLGISLSSVPEDLAVASNQGSSLELRPLNPAFEGIMWFEVGPPVQAVNLVEAVQQHQQHIQGRPDGEYLGAQELQGDFGVAFYSRGRYNDRGLMTEETVVYRIHPEGDRLLAIHSRYPAPEDSAARVEQLLDGLSRVE